MIGYALFLALSLVAPPGDGPVKGAGARMRIELNAFSGRENPTWNLTDEQAKEFATALDALKAGDPGKPLKDGLGYRGFKVTGFRDYDELVVWNDVVQGTRAGKTTRWHDKDRALERLLLKTSKAHVDEPVYKYVASEVEKD
jgi:hypothetical protein